MKTYISFFLPPISPSIHKTMFSSLHGKLWLRKYWFRSKGWRLCVFVCCLLSIKYSNISSYMQILFMEKNTNSIKWDSVREFFGSSWHLILFRSFLKTLFLLVASLLLPFFFSVEHAFECGETKSIGFYLLLVIDCEKLISEEGCAGYWPKKIYTGQTVLSSIKIKSCFSFFSYIEWWFTKHNKLSHPT